MIVPGSSVTWSESTAVKLPKRFVSPRASSGTDGSRTGTWAVEIISELARLVSGPVCDEMAGHVT